MGKLRTAVAALTLLVTPAVLMAQRGPEPQQGTGQNNPDMERGSSPAAGKSEQPSTSNVPTEQGTGQNNPDTQQTHHQTTKQKHKKHGGSHDQASPQT